MKQIPQSNTAAQSIRSTRNRSIFKIDKSVFDEVVIHQTDLSGYALSCMQQSRSKFQKLK